MIRVNDKEIENIYFNGTKLDHVYVNGVMVYESTVYVAKPTISGAYTFDTLEHKAVISNTNEDAYVISGVTNASAAGTYTVKFTLNKGYAWNDESTDPIELKWNIAKRVISVPSLNTTSFAWVEGAQHGVIVNGIDTTYVSQSGDLSQTDNGNNIGTQHAVTWSLKYPASTTWTDGSNSNKSQTWAVSWQNGTSHYAADLYNSGWNSGMLEAAVNNETNYVRFNADHVLMHNGSGGVPKLILKETSTSLSQGKTIHIAFDAYAIIGSGQTHSSQGYLYLQYYHTSGFGPYGDSAVHAKTSKDLSFKYSTTSSEYHYGFALGANTEAKVTRIWAT